MSKYTDLITNYHAGKPKFVEHVDLSTRPLIDVSAATSGLITAFDVDTAVGVQLDVIGEWVGRSRRVSTPVTGVYFSLDEEKVGWDQGIWQGPYDPDDGYIELGDDVYRFVIKVKIAINNWNGQNDTLPEIINNALDGAGIRLSVIDNQDMSISVWVQADPEFYMNDLDRMILDSAINRGPFIVLPDDYSQSLYFIDPIEKIDAELFWVIRNGYLTVKAAGVRIRETIRPSEGFQFFGFDINNTYVSGWDSGAWEENI
ncbi:DUF2612 domain-containing protein [Klebsiella pneumoniae]